MTSAGIDPLTYVIHEIKAPLGLVSMAAQAAADATEDESVHEQCEAIVRVAGRMLRLTSSLPALASGSGGTSQEPFYPTRIARSVFSDLAKMGTPVVQDAERCYDELEALGSASHFEALVQSVLMNAIDHADLDMPITIRLKREGNQFRLSIGNRTSQTMRHRGLGLGTIIADRLATAAGCEITRISTPCSYVVELTLRACGPPPDGAQPRHPAPPP